MDIVSSCFASGISATIKIFEVAYQIQATDEQTSDILNTTSHVERNLQEAQRLFRTKAALLDRHDYEWVVSTIRDTRGALQSVAKLIEPARVAKMTQKDIGMMSKTCWAFKSNPKARDKHSMLNVCHQSLMVVIARLHSINLPTVSETPDQGTLLSPPPYDNNMEKLWTWQDQRRNRQRSTTNLRQESMSAPVFVATTDWQELGVPSLDADSHSITASMMNSQRANSAQEVRSYNILPTASYPPCGWPNASHSSISRPESAIELPCANRRSTLPVYVSHQTAVTLEKKPQVFEMSAVPLSPKQQMLRFIGQDMGQTRKPIDRSIPSYLLPGISSQSCSPALTDSNLTPQSWGNLAFAGGLHPSKVGSEPVEKSGIPSLADHPAYRSQLEAEAKEEGAQFLVSDGDPGAGARWTEKASIDRMRAIGAWSNSSPDLTARRSDVGDRMRSTENRSGGGTKLRGSWLAYQTSLRDSRHGREGAGST